MHWLGRQWPLLHIWYRVFLQLPITRCHLDTMQLYSQRNWQTRTTSGWKMHLGPFGAIQVHYFIADYARPIQRRTLRSDKVWRLKNQERVGHELNTIWPEQTKLFSFKPHVVRKWRWNRFYPVWPNWTIRIPWIKFRWVAKQRLGRQLTH